MTPRQGAEVATDRSFLQPTLPVYSASPQGYRAARDITMRMPEVPQAAQTLFRASTGDASRYVMLLAVSTFVGIVLRQYLLRRSFAATLRVWLKALREKVVYLADSTQKLVTTLLVVSATFVTLLGRPVGALSTSEAPPQPTVQRQLPATKKMPRPLSTFIQRRSEAPKQKMISYRSKDYIFSDGLTRTSRLDREFDDLLWYSLANRRAHQARNMATVAEAAIAVGGVRAGLLAFERWQKEEERKDIEEELERTGMYVSVDASSVTEFTDANTGKKKAAESTQEQNPVIPGSLVVHYELPSATSSLEKAVREKVEGSEFSTVFVDELQYALHALGDVQKEHMQELSTLVYPKIPARQAPKMEAGALGGRVFLTDLGPGATEAVLRGFGNRGTRGMIQDAFRGPVATALGVQPDQVAITNLLRNRDPLFGDGGRLADGPVRKFLNNKAPGVLRWLESTTSADSADFWENAATQTIYRDDGPKDSATDGEQGSSPSIDDSGDRPDASP